jgi:hypothetical protein
VVVDVEFAERYWYPDDGGQVWLSGYQLIDPATGAFLARDAPALAERGLHVAGVAGAGRHHADALASDELAAEIAPALDAGRPWSAVVLREQRPSPRDPRSGATMLLAPAEAIELRVH